MIGMDPNEDRSKEQGRTARRRRPRRQETGKVSFCRAAGPRSCEERKLTGALSEIFGNIQAVFSKQLFRRSLGEGGLETFHPRVSNDWKI